VALTSLFLQRKSVKYNALKLEIEALKSEEEQREFMPSPKP